MISFEYVFTYLILFITTLAIGIYLYFNNAYKYWSRKNVPFLEPKFPYGNSTNMETSRTTLGPISKDFYEEFKQKGYKFGGIFTMARPKLMLVDPEIIKDVWSKDFEYFTDRSHYYNEDDDPISAHMFSLEGTKWRNLRTKLTPTFTSGKMKMMFESILECADYMKQALNEQNNGKEVEIRDYLARFTIDVIGTCAFGIKCNSFKDTDAEFIEMSKKIFAPLSIFRKMQLLLATTNPDLGRKFHVRSHDKKLGSFFQNVTKSTVEYREKNNVNRKDFLQLLIDLRKNEKTYLTIEQVSAQVFLFFVAGFDTSSTAMNFAAYELSKNPEVQEKLREEINNVLKNHNNQITYESLSDMKYLHQVIEESMRMYPPLVTITRDCVKDYKIRDTDITIEKGMAVLVSTLGLHHDPEYYPDPEKFDPDRFTDKNKQQRPVFSYLPFGEGPRNCIGMRFGMMQAKIGLITLIRNFKLLASQKTKEVHLDERFFLLKTTNKIYVRLEKL